MGRMWVDRTPRSANDHARWLRICQSVRRSDVATHVIDCRMLQRAILVFLTLSGLLVGIWATLFPRAFYDDFPGFGRVWVAVDGPYNEHLVRDVGQFSLALAVATVFAVVTMHALVVRAVAAAWLVDAVPHFVHHLRHLDRYDTTDTIGNVVSLSSLVVLPAAVLMLSIRSAGRSQSRR